MAQRTIRLMSTTDDGFDDVCKDTPKSSVRKRYGTWPWPPGIHTNGISSAYVVSREPGVYDPVDCPCGPNCECEVCTCAPCCACHLRESCGCGYKPWRTRYFSTTSPKWLYLTDELIEEWDKAKLMSESSTSSSR